MTSLEIIQLRAPQWGSDPRMSGLISLAQGHYSSTCAGVHYNELVALQVLHWLAREAHNEGDPGTGTNSGQGHSGAIKRLQEGDLQKEFSYTTSFVTNDLDDTSYGKELQLLMKRILIAARTAYVSGC